MLLHLDARALEDWLAACPDAEDLGEREYTVDLYDADTPLSIAQALPAAYHGVPEVFLPSRRARIVTIIARVVSAFGENLPLPVPDIRPSSET